MARLTVTTVLPTPRSESILSHLSSLKVLDRIMQHGQSCGGEAGDYGVGFLSPRGTGPRTADDGGVKSWAAIGP